MSIKLVWRGSESTETRRIAMPSSNFDILKDLVCKKFPVQRQDFVLRFVYTRASWYIFSLCCWILAKDEKGKLMCAQMCNFPAYDVNARTCLYVPHVLNECYYTISSLINGYCPTPFLGTTTLMGWRIHVGHRPNCCHCKNALALMAAS